MEKYAQILFDCVKAIYWAKIELEKFMENISLKCESASESWCQEFQVTSFQLCQTFEWLKIMKIRKIKNVFFELF